MLWLVTKQFVSLFVLHRGDHARCTFWGWLQHWVVWGDQRGRVEFNAGGCYYCGQKVVFSSTLCNRLRIKTIVYIGSARLIWSSTLCTCQLLGCVPGSIEAMDACIRNSELRTCSVRVRVNLRNSCWRSWLKWYGDYCVERAECVGCVQLQHGVLDMGLHIELTNVRMRRIVKALWWYYTDNAQLATGRG